MQYLQLPCDMLLSSSLLNLLSKRTRSGASEGVRFINLFCLHGFEILFLITSVFDFANIDIRELKHQAFLLSRRPTGTKLPADVAYLNTSCGRGDHHGAEAYKPLFASVLVGKTEWLQAPNKLSINLCKLIVYLQ